ncbi:MAG: hypothetical protein R3C11_13300 [Planctomycetaceae bacterium]
MKNWTKLTVSDFEYDEEKVGGARIKFNKQELIIQIPNSNYASERNVEFYLEALSGWIKRGKQIASLTEEKIEEYLPKQKVKPEELDLWMLYIGEPDKKKLPDSEIGKPHEIEFMYRLSGYYVKESNDPDAFGETSKIFLELGVDNFIIDWDNPEIFIETY